MIKRMAFYLRLSMADGDSGRDNKESNSIENQRNLLQNFVNTSEELADEVAEYIDDGYTGTNFKRPAFQQLIEDTKRGHIHTILVKDLSRLGRDYIGVGDYLEQIFPVLGVRFIAVNSNYDSNKYIGRTMGMDVAVNNLVNSMYSRDISKKVKAALHTKWKQGISTTASLPYGYVKDLSVQGSWKIDPDAADIVKLIFEKAVKKWSTRQITDMLNERGIDTPSRHKEKNNQYGGRRRVPESECLWDTNMVRTILRRYEYTGAFVHNFREKVMVDSSVTRSVPKQQQYITENAHEALISKEEFENAQTAIQIVSQAKIKRDNEYPLRGKIRCGVCRLAMTHLKITYETVYFCPHKKKSGRFSKCCGESISAKKIHTEVLSLLKKKLQVLDDLSERMKTDRENHSQENETGRKRITQEMDVLKAERIRQYEDYAEGIISKESYFSEKTELSSKIQILQTSLDHLYALEKESTAVKQEVIRISEEAKKARGEEKLTKEMVDAFIDTVYVYDAKRIEVIFKFENLL